MYFAAYDMDVPSAKRFITSLLESGVEEGQKCELHHQCQEER